MLRRSLLALAAALLLLFWAAVPTLAGGWAITTLDAVPNDFEAGQSYSIGYTIRQHGVRPYPDAATSIRIADADGRTERFRARPEGEPGHYVAEVRFPAAGVWQWEVDQSPFAPQPLGTVQVALASAPAAPLSAAALPAAPRPSLSLTLLRVALPVAALGALALFALRLTALTRRARTVGAAELGALRASD